MGNCFGSTLSLMVLPRLLLVSIPPIQMSCSNHPEERMMPSLTTGFSSDTWLSVCTLDLLLLESSSFGTQTMRTLSICWDPPSWDFWGQNMTGTLWLLMGNSHVGDIALRVRPPMEQSLRISRSTALTTLAKELSKTFLPIPARTSKRARSRPVRFLFRYW